MTKHCRVCLSPNRSKYDELRLKGYLVKEIFRISRIDFKENIPIHSFYYHFQHHLDNIIREGIKSSKLRE